MKKSLLVIYFCLLFSTYIGYAQKDLNYNVAIELSGFTSTNDSVPLWFYTNNSATVGLLSDFVSIAEATVALPLTETSELSAGVSAYYRNNVNNELQRKELYLQYKNAWFEVTAGAKEQPVVFLDLSATNKNFLWSGNARALPGVRINTSEPINLSNTFGIDLGIAHYELNDNRYVDNTRLHYKYLTLIAKFSENHRVSATLQHFVQWAGTSPVFGELKSDFSAFVDVFTARESPELGVDGEIFNAVGNHLGSYLFEYELGIRPGVVTLYHEHPFEDGSGSGFANFPDGVWGVFFKPNNETYFKGVLYEYITTKNQSGSTGGSAFDNYFNNSVYRSGWTYEGRSMGLPFMITTPTGVLDEDGVTFVSNSLAMHHLGVTGSISNFDLKVKSSFVENFGRTSKLFTTSLVTSHHYITTTYKTEKYGSITILFGADTSNMSDTILGAGATYRYQF